MASGFKRPANTFIKQIYQILEEHIFNNFQCFYIFQIYQLDTEFENFKDHSKLCVRDVRM